MNHARALVHIYQDGSVGISTGAVEMGQSVNTKMIQVAASVFSIDDDLIKLETTNTTRVANTSPTAASATADEEPKAAAPEETPAVANEAEAAPAAEAEPAADAEPEADADAKD